ncbi:MAG: flagellar basal body-associated FliL family protein, partial [Planctomycetota bacterium]
MADKDNEKTTEKKEKSSDGKVGILTWVIMLVVVLVLSGSGFVVGRLVADSAGPRTEQEIADQAAAQADAKVDEQADDNGETASTDTWYYDTLESVVVNPDEPGATRFVRVGLILEMSAGFTKEDAEKLIPQKQPLLINWLNLYFKGLSLDQMEDEKDMNHILAQITDAFN